MSPPDDDRYTLAWLRRLNRATVTPYEAGKVLGMTPRTVIRLVQSGEIRGKLRGGRYYVDRDGLIEDLIGG